MESNSVARLLRASPSASGASQTITDSSVHIFICAAYLSLTLIELTGLIFTARAALILRSFHLGRLLLLNVEPFVRRPVANTRFMFIQTAKSKPIKSVTLTISGDIMYGSLLVPAQFQCIL